jgi:hypothetical protein
MLGWLWLNLGCHGPDHGGEALGRWGERPVGPHQHPGARHRQAEIDGTRASSFRST